MPFTQQEILDAYNDYHSGALDDNQRGDYEGDVDAGNFTLPPGVTKENFREGLVGPTSPVMLNKATIEAFNNGDMSDEEVEALKSDYEAGLITIPEGFELDEPGLWTDFTNWFKETVTGDKRSTPEIEAVENWFRMPEMDVLSWKGAKAALATIASNPDETVNILKEQFPNMEFKKDSKGNNIMLSENGLWYGMQPGMTASDVVRGAGVVGVEASMSMAAPASIPIQMAIGAGVQTGIETMEASQGGEFDLTPIALGAGGEALGGLASKAGKAAYRAGKRVYQRTAEEVVEEVVEKTPIATMLRKASLGDTKAMKELADLGVADKEILKAADELGIELNVGQLAESKQFREVSKMVEESVPGSQTKLIGDEAYVAVNKKANQLIEEVGGTQDYSQLNQSIKRQWTEVQDGYEDAAEKLYKEINKAIPAKTPTKADTFVTGIEKRIADSGDKGIKGLTPAERRLYKILKPEQTITPSPIIGAPDKIKNIYSTYDMIDNHRKDLNNAIFRSEGPFKDGSKRHLRVMAANLLEDQKVIAKQFGVEDTFELAREALTNRKKVEEKMISLFGKKLGDSIVGDLDKAVRSLGKGDENQFIDIIKNIPESMREVVTASALSTAFGMRAVRGELDPRYFVNWYKMLKKNKPAFNALMTNLPKEARDGLQSMYKFNEGLMRSSRETIGTGKLNQLTREFRGADNIMSSVYQFAKKSAIGIPLEAATSSMGFHGVGLGLGAMIASHALGKQSKESVMLAADALLTSPQFKQMILSGGSQAAASKMAKSSVWNKFYKEMGKPQALNKPEQWLMGVYHSQLQTMKKDEE